MEIYPIETAVRLTVQFTTAQGVPIDPTTVALELTDPTNTVNMITSGIVQDGVGSYHYDWAGTLAGFWFIRFQGTGTITVASMPVMVKLI
jgi:hypothetical protein